MKLRLAHPFEASTSTTSTLPLEDLQPEYIPTRGLEPCVVKLPWVKSALVGGVHLLDCQILFTESIQRHH